MRNLQINNWLRQHTRRLLRLIRVDLDGKNILRQNYSLHSIVTKDNLMTQLIMMKFLEQWSKKTNISYSLMMSINIDQHFAYIIVIISYNLRSSTRLILHFLIYISSIIFCYIFFYFLPLAIDILILTLIIIKKSYLLFYSKYYYHIFFIFAIILFFRKKLKASIIILISS